MQNKEHEYIVKSGYHRGFMAGLSVGTILLIIVVLIIIIWT